MCVGVEKGGGEVSIFTNSFFEIIKRKSERANRGIGSENDHDRGSRCSISNKWSRDEGKRLSASHDDRLLTSSP